MSKSGAIIWQIGLYNKVEGKEEAECKLCKENGDKKTKIVTKNWSTNVLVSHLKSQHKETDFLIKYNSLVSAKEDLAKNRAMDKHVVRNDYIHEPCPSIVQ